MSPQTVHIELSESLYQTAVQIAKATNRSLADVLRESLHHSLPPLDDVPADEAAELAELSGLDDAALWRVADSILSVEQQSEMQHLLDRQGQRRLTAEEQTHLHMLMDEYGRAMVRRAHAWLLLARRGYRVPVQQNGS